MTNLQIIKHDAVLQRARALNEIDSGATVRSRGVWLFAEHNGVSLPNVAGETHEVDLTAKSIKEEIASIIDRKMPEGMDVTKIEFSLFGGWDAADSLWAMNEGDYEPCCSEWDGTVKFDYQMNVIED